MIDSLYKRITASELTDEKLEKYYRENIGKYTRKTVRARHILVKTESEARNILEKLKEDGSFEKLYYQANQGITKEHGAIAESKKYDSTGSGKGIIERLCESA